MSAAIPTASVAGQNQQQAASIAAQSSFISNFDAAFQVNALTFPAPGSWPNNPLAIQKRQACTLSQPSTDPTASATTAPSQSTNGGSITGNSATPSITPPPSISSAVNSASSSEVASSPSLSSV